MLPVVLADLSIEKITGTSKAHGKSLDVMIEILVKNNGDDDATDVDLIVTLPPTTHQVSSTPAGRVIAQQPPAHDPNVPAGASVIGGTELRIPSLSTAAQGNTYLAKVNFTMVAEAKAIGNGVSVGAFVRGTRPDSDGSNNAKCFKVP